jgi:hypothetical protein
MEPAEKIEGGGRKALAYNQATQMVVHERLREREKDSVYPVGDGEKQKARNLSKKKGPTAGLEPTWI